MMIVHPTFRVGIRLGATGPEFVLRVPEPDLRALTAVLIFNQANFTVEQEADPFMEAEDIVRQSITNKRRPA